MAGKTRSAFLSLVIIAVLVFGAMSPTIAYADDRKPPATPPTESGSGVATATGDDAEAAAKATSTPDAATAEPSSVPTEATTAPTSAPTEVTAEATSTPAPTTTEATSTPDAAPAQAAGSEGNSSTSGETAAPPATEVAASVTRQVTPAPGTSSSVLDQVPQNTTVTVLDAKGQSQPLATQSAANAIATSDPIWCPQGQAPTPGANGCTTSFNSFSALLTFLSGNATYQGAGTIYVQQGAYNGGESSIDLNSPSYNLSNIKNSDLTITGGWNTTTNTVDPASTSSFTIPILIGTGANPWGGSLVINNITISQTNGTGLTLYSQNDITLSNVNVTNSVTGAGAELNAGNSVSINNSNFNQNRKAGAIVRAKGDVAIANSSFSNPANGHGRRQIVGLDVLTDGSVTLSNVLANVNREVGATINAGGRVVISNSFFSNTKTIKNRKTTSPIFLGYGLQVVTPDSIDLASVTASNNFLWGASLQAGGDINITDSVFNANTTANPGFIDDTGLIVNSGGAVTLNNVQASDNRLIGATIKASGDVSINNSSFVNNNGVLLSADGTPTFYGYGLSVVTSGNIFLNVVDASNNTLFGAHLEAGKDVAVSDGHFDNQTSGSSTDQTGRGLEVVSGGNVFLSNVSVNNNQTFGANIQAGGNIFLDTITATNNGLDGVDAQGNCTTVALNAGTYSNNGGHGLAITNAELLQSGSPVFANNGAGNISQDPGSCVFPPSGTTGGTGGSGNSTGSGTSNPAPIPLQNNSLKAALRQGTGLVIGTDGFFSVTGLDSPGLTLDSFLADIESANEDNHLGTFVGQYAYVYSNSVLHIVALLPFSDSLAMAEP